MQFTRDQFGCIVRCMALAYIPDAEQTVAACGLINAILKWDLTPELERSLVGQVYDTYNDTVLSHLLHLRPDLVDAPGNFDGNVLLHCASRWHPRRVRLLVAVHKANVNACDYRGRSVLYGSRDIDVVRYLLDNGANPCIGRYMPYGYATREYVVIQRAMYLGIFAKWYVIPPELKRLLIHFLIGYQNQSLTWLKG